MIRKSLYVLIFVVIYLTSCRDSPWEAEVPTYLLVDTFSLTTTAEEGSNSHDIRDVWVYDNTSLLGAYELPAEVPLLGSEIKNLVLYPGIRENGNSFFPDLYFLYTPDSLTIDPTTSSEFSIQPSTEYDSRTKFAFIENFESGNIFTESLTSEDSSEMQIVTDTVFEGNKSGMIEVSDDDSTAVVVATEEAYGPFFEDGLQAYLELNYKTEVPITIGYSGVSFDGETQEFLKVTLNPVQEWRKAYIEFTEEFSGDDIFRTRIVLRVDYDERYTEKPSGRAYFDNVKLVHF